MTGRRYGRSRRWLLLTSLIVAAAVSCARGADDPQDRSGEHADSDPAELEQEASQAVTAAPVRPGATLDRQQLVQLLGSRTPAAVGESCPALGQMCAPRSFAPTTSCGGFSDTCASSGTQNGVWIDFTCLNINGNAVCTAVASQTTVTVACNRVTNGTSCGAPRCDAPFCLSYPSACAEQTTQLQNCFSAGVCSNEVCTGQTMTQQAVGTCQRDSDGNVCGGCRSGFIGECGNGVCHCSCRRC